MTRRFAQDSGFWAAGAFWLAAVLAGLAPALAEGPPPPRPPHLGQPAPEAAPAPAAPAAAPAPAPVAAPPAPTLGPVTHLPLPRFVSLKTNEGNARRGPGLTHRIDWVFTRAGMPLRITAEHEHWRRIEDQDGMGGWVHYSLLSGARSVLITEDMAELRESADPRAAVVAQAEMGVIGKVLRCTEDWCRISADGEKGWLPKTALWGVLPGEVIE